MPALSSALKVAVQLVQFADTPAPTPRSTPLLGQQVRDVMHEVGYRHDEIEAFYEQGVVKTDTGQG